MAFISFKLSLTLLSACPSGIAIKSVTNKDDCNRGRPGPQLPKAPFSSLCLPSFKRVHRLVFSQWCFCSEMWQDGM